MEAQVYKVAVIGGGASGMMAALSASRNLPLGQVILLEKNPGLGKKIYATGNGRCNFSNRTCKWQDYGGQDISLVRCAFEYLSPTATRSLFKELGIQAREESNGRLYPYSEQASSVVEALQDELKDNGVTVLTNSEVLAIKKIGKEFLVEFRDGLVKSNALIITTGGKAGHRYGSTGDGYGFAKQLGHSLQRPLPALVQIITDDPFASKVKGVRAKGEVVLMKGQHVTTRERGEIQFIENGLSGICIFDLSRYLGGDPGAFSIRIDLFPEYSSDILLEMLRARRKKMKQRPAESLLKGMLNDKLVPVYLELAGVTVGSYIHQINEEQLIYLSRFLKNRELGIKATKGWVDAQVTVGGVRGDELQANTLESKIVPGLFFAGEVLDIDGKCGGWNLQWAWSSGFLAGYHAASKAK